MRNSVGDMIFVPRNGFNTSKSLSPVTMQTAFAATANSRNLLSLGSRHSEILTTGSMKSASFSMSFSIFVRFIKLAYLLNLGKSSFSVYSLNMDLLQSIVQLFCAFLKAMSETLFFIKTALISTFVSIITFIYSVVPKIGRASCRERV